MSVPTRDPAIMELVAESAVRRLIAQYGRAADALDADGVAMLFSEDGALEVGLSRAEGRPAIAAWIRSIAAKHPPRGTHHAANTILTSCTGDTIEAVTDMVFVGRPAEGALPAVLAMGRYEDRFVLAAGAWKFSSRRILFG